MNDDFERQKLEELKQQQEQAASRSRAESPQTPYAGQEASGRAEREATSREAGEDPSRQRERLETVAETLQRAVTPIPNAPHMQTAGLVDLALIAGAAAVKVGLESLPGLLGIGPGAGRENEGKELPQAEMVATEIAARSEEIIRQQTEELERQRHAQALAQAMQRKL